MSYDQSYPQGAPQGAPQTNPGQVLGIVSIVLGLTGCLSLIGVILGFMSRSRSKRAGASTTLGTVGLVISAIALVIAIVFGSIAGYGAYQLSQKCQELGSGTHQEGGVTYECP